MLPSHITAQAIQLRIAIYNQNRNYIDVLNRKYNLEKLTRALVIFGKITASERKNALKLRTRISNPSCKCVVR
jgi:hypothetical protein